ncbi:calcium-binding protein [Tropicimonas marinistellae]|uniref:calcium-binding protein n=1 Tax=Tropicimonas marinistellae TaxID=1739787 RepID=UPI000831D3F5|nr:calcium-binding protein [Tropicimonas marinistellae]
MSATPIVIIAGQSNAALTPLPAAAAERLGEMGALVVHHAISGSPLSADRDIFDTGDWEASGAEGSGEHLADLQARIDALVNPGGKGHIEGAYVAGMIWVQGEADSIARDASADYAENLAQLHTALVARYGTHDMVVSMLSDAASEARQEGIFNPVKEAGVAVIRQAQAAVADADATVTALDPDTLGASLGLTVAEMFRSDLTHYSEAFGAELGRALAAEFDLSGTASVQVGTEHEDWFTVSENSPVQQLIGFNKNDTADFSGLGFAVAVETYLGECSHATARDMPGKLDVSMLRVETLVGTAFDDMFRLGDTCRKVEAGGGRDRVVGSARNDNLKLGTGNDVANGKAGDDAMRGEDGDDRLHGGAGADKLIGGAGNDVLRGGADADWLYGGDGSDVLRPGEGADTIVWRARETGRDVLIGFEQGKDRLAIDIAGVDYDDLQVRSHRSKLIVEVQSGSTDVEIVLRDCADLTLTADDFVFAF